MFIIFDDVIGTPSLFFGSVVLECSVVVVDYLDCKLPHSIFIAQEEYQYMTTERGT